MKYLITLKILTLKKFIFIFGKYLQDIIKIQIKFVSRWNITNVYILKLHLSYENFQYITESFSM